MPKRAEELGALAVSRLRAPGLHFVGGVAGLALQVTPSGDGRSWTLRVTIGGRRRDFGLGAYPGVTLADARNRAREARARIREGVDPIEERRAAQRALRAAVSALTFRQCAEAYIGVHESQWKSVKHAQQWRNTLAAYAYPVMGEVAVRDVRKEHVLAALEPIWSSKRETASRLRGRIELVLSYAMQAGYRPEGFNPARWRGGLDKLLPSPVVPVKNHTALTLPAVGAFMRRLREAAGSGARALEFAILTAARSGEVRGATWGELDLERGIWTVPAVRMKSGREHRVPLSPAALALLDELPCLREPAGVLFPATRGGMLSDMTLSAVTRRMNVPAVPHGFRSTFRDWAAERTNYPRDVAEMALAHNISDKVEAAYRRGDMLERRRAMMNDWAAFLTEPASSAEVVPITKSRAA